MDAIDGTRKNSGQRGYLLAESIVSFLLISLCITVYLPFAAGLLTKIDQEKKLLEMNRIGYEQVQKISVSQEMDNTFETGGVIYQIERTNHFPWKGVKLNNETEEVIFEITQIIISNP